jgi:hypothetical protein
MRVVTLLAVLLDHCATLDSVERRKGIVLDVFFMRQLPSTGGMKNSGLKLEA